MFSDSTLGLLRQAGWFEGRRVDTRPFELILNEDGFELFEVQREFLSQFGGLHLKDADDYRRFHFDLDADYFQREAIEGAAMELGTKLSPIGELSEYHELMTMSPEGKVYYVYEDYFDLVADSGEEAIEVLCSRRRGSVS